MRSCALKPKDVCMSEGCDNSYENRCHENARAFIFVFLITVGMAMNLSYSLCVFFDQSNKFSFIGEDRLYDVG